VLDGVRELKRAILVELEVVEAAVEDRAVPGVLYCGPSWSPKALAIAILMIMLRSEQDWGVMMYWKWWWQQEEQYHESV
jgi:hypothetical protein